MQLKIAEATRSVNGQMRRALFFTHRWLGILTCLLCVMWFLSGLVMLYVPFPTWRDAERLATLPPLAAPQITITPDAAVTTSGLARDGLTLRLEMWGTEPVYLLQREREMRTVSAADGRLIGPVDAGTAERHLRQIFPAERVTYQGEVHRDQWTVTKKFDAHRPLHLFTVGDGRSIYISSSTGEIVQDATRAERAWNWLGSIPHWIYFTPIRTDQELWRQVVMWVSGPVVIGAALGLWVGILRLRPRNWRTGKRVTPFRGWLQWHHIGGLVAGVFLVTWIFSGWLSVNPFQMFSRPELTAVQKSRYAGPESSETGVGLSALRAALAVNATELKLTRLAGEPLLVTRDAALNRTLFDGAGVPRHISEQDLGRAAQSLFPDNRITERQILTGEDFYWRSHHGRRVLPVLRVKFDDAQATWVHVDMVTGEVAGVTDRGDRADRWLFDLLHKFDLPVLLHNGPARDLLIWILSFGGLVISVSGVVIAWRHLARRNREPVGAQLVS